MFKTATCLTVTLAGLTAFAEVGSIRMGEDGIKRSSASAEERLALIAPVAAGVLRCRPTFCSCGVCYGAPARLEGVRFEYRQAGGEWTTADDFTYFEETRDYRGSLLGLEENTDYEIRVAQGDKVLASEKTRTWSSEIKIAKTVTLDPARVKFPLEIRDRGNPTGWIRYTMPSGKTIVNDTDQPAIVLDGAQFVVLEGLKIEGGKASKSIRLKGTKCVRILNCELYGWGRDSEVKYDGLGRPFVPGSPAPTVNRNANGGFSMKGSKGQISGDYAIEIDRGCSETVVERCYIHDCRVHANSWYYSHPAGGGAILARSPDHSTVIRWNDLVGSDLHRWDDAVTSGGNFSENGGLNRDADVYGNFMIFANDDCIELDGGQQNVRCWGNRFESSLVGVSIQGCMVSPVYVFQNGFYGMCDQFGNAGQTIKTGGGAHGNEAYAFVRKNLFWGDGMGMIWMPLLRSQLKDNVFCGNQKIVRQESSPLSSSVGDRFGVEIPEEGLSGNLPVRPVGFRLSRSRFSGITVKAGKVEPGALSFSAKSTCDRPLGFTIAKNRDFPWFNVIPETGVIPAGGEVTFTVTFDTAKMNDRHFYRGAFLVRTAEGLSRAVSLYAETDFVPPKRPDRPDDTAVYIEEQREVALVRGDEAEHRYEFVVPKDGRYHFMIHASTSSVGGGKALMAAVDDEPFEKSTARLWTHPVWSPVAPGNKFGNTLRYWDFKQGEKHVLKIKAGKTDITYDAVVMTDNPGSFEPR